MQRQLKAVFLPIPGNREISSTACSIFLLEKFICFKSKGLRIFVNMNYTLFLILLLAYVGVLVVIGKITSRGATNATFFNANKKRFLAAGKFRYDWCLAQRCHFY